MGFTSESNGVVTTTGRVYEDRRTLRVQASSARLWSVLERLGGREGWYHANWLWALRGYLDCVAGGVGSRNRSGSSPAGHGLRHGSVVGFWKVLIAEPRSHLLLLAEMKVPGVATLEFKIQNRGDGGCEFRQTARFWPSNFWGSIYWYSLVGVHHYVFSGMIRKIAEIAERSSSGEDPLTSEPAGLAGGHS